VESRIETLRAEYVQRGETLPLEVVHTLRQDKAKPVLEKFKEWIEKLLPGTPPNSALGKALGYGSRQWPKLVRYLDHAEVPAHNNFVERQIKQYALGRRAWLFAYDQIGAQASANLFSLVMSALANDVPSFPYLCYVFEHLPMATTLEDIEALLPWNVKPVLEAQKKRQDAAP
jgi:Transposase IS66 family/IS66 C-terminal element